MLVEHYTTLPDLTAKAATATSNFFQYFLTQWGPDSHVSNWFAGAHPFVLTNNQGSEGTQVSFT